MLPAVPPSAWRPTHLVNGRGVPAWEAPDPSTPTAAQLAPWTEVQVLLQEGEWANVVLANGWQGWVDAGQLIRRAG